MLEGRAITMDTLAGVGPEGKSPLRQRASSVFGDSTGGSGAEGQTLAARWGEMAGAGGSAVGQGALPVGGRDGSMYQSDVARRVANMFSVPEEVAAEMAAEMAQAGRAGSPPKAGGRADSPPKVGAAAAVRATGSTLKALGTEAGGRRVSGEPWRGSEPQQGVRAVGGVAHYKGHG